MINSFGKENTEYSTDDYIMKNPMASLGDYI